MFGDIIKEFIL